MEEVGEVLKQTTADWDFGRVTRPCQVSVLAVGVWVVRFCPAGDWGHGAVATEATADSERET